MFGFRFNKIRDITFIFHGIKLIFKIILLAYNILTLKYIIREITVFKLKDLDTGKKRKINGIIYLS